jgi:signal transduction histidine kinase
LKLLGAFAPLLVALAGVTIYEVAGALAEIDDVRGQTELANASLGPLSLLNALEKERNAASIYLLGLEGAVTLEIEENSEARPLTDEAAEQLRDQIARLDPSVQADYEEAFADLDSLQDTRNQIDAHTGARDLNNVDLSASVFAAYTAVSEELYAANEKVALAIDDPDVRQGAELALLSARQTDLVARMVRDMVVAQIGGASPDGLNDNQEISGLASLLSRLRENEEQMRASADGAYLPFLQQLFASDEVTVFPTLVDEAIATGHIDIGEILAAATGEGEGASVHTVFREQVADVLRDQAHAREADASDQARWMGIAAVLATIIALVIAWLVARSITRPLDALTDHARTMANTRLPGVVRGILETPLGEDVEVEEIAPITVRSRDEVVDVVEALTTVQRTAVELAIEQAVMRRNIADAFLNMGRRNQNLLARQLEFITELELGEANPDTLANLFRLDHLATRMRRNAESLLVLAGIDPPRRWAQPVVLGDVIRAAVGEVEDFQRVAVTSVTPASLAGSAASDLAHVMAELIENGLTYSPPDTPVEVRGAPTGDGYRLAVVDSGLGMPPEEIEQANQRLSGTESFTVAPSRYLGHYVAGHLAARHRVRVHLQAARDAGVAALIDIPHDLITGVALEASSANAPARALAAAPAGGGAFTQPHAAALAAGGGDGRPGSGFGQPLALPQTGEIPTVAGPPPLPARQPQSPAPAHSAAPTAPLFPAPAPTQAPAAPGQAPPPHPLLDTAPFAPVNPNWDPSAPRSAPAAPDDGWPGRR